MLERLFGSKTRVELLKIFCLHPEKEFYLRELQRKTGKNITSVKRELENLKKLNLIKSRKKGNLFLYKFNKASPISDEIKKIVIKTIGVGEILKKHIKRLGKIRFALIYGSMARGDVTIHSDIDLLIIGKIDKEKFFDVLWEMEKSTEREINYIIWDEKTFRKNVKKEHYLLKNIIKNPFIMLAGDENEFRRIVEKKNNSENRAR